MGAGDGTLTDAQRASFDEEGYLLLPEVLSGEEVQGLLGAADAVLASMQHAGRMHSQSAQGLQKGGALKVVRAVEQTEALDFLLDHPRTFGVLVSLLGPFLQVLGTEIFLRLPSEDGRPLVEWHTDGGPSMRGLVCHPGAPLLQLKIQFFLTDLLDVDRGNFTVVPGSHRRPFPAGGIGAGTEPPGAVRIVARAGDAVVFAWSLWHAVGPNRTAAARRSVTLRYGPLWARPYDYERLAPATWERLTPRRRRLMGDMGPSPEPYEYYYPDEEAHARLLREEP